MNFETVFNSFKAESISYDKRLMLGSPNPIERLIDNFLLIDAFGNKSILKQKALNNFLTNILVAEKENKVLALPCGSYVYSYSPFYGFDHYTYTIMGWVFDTLKEAGFIGHSKGYFNKETNKGVVSRVWATEKLLDIVNQYSDAAFEYTDESEEPNHINFLFGQKLNRVKFTKPIVLKDKNKRLLPYRINKKIIKMQKNIDKYNALINQHSITIPQSVLPAISNYGAPILVEVGCKLLPCVHLDCILYRVFNNGKFTVGGRFYGGEYQGLSEIQRSQVLIDGEESCEVDYSACHIRMLYNLEKMNYKDDPYKIDGIKPAMRLYVKKMMQMLINANSISQAIAAFRKFIDNVTLTDNEKSELKSSAYALASMIIKIHKILNKYISTGIGLRLQYKDSRIAERILIHFTRKQIVCLCIHDSFIVKKCYQQELIEVMQREYKRIMGFDCELKIK